MCRIILLCHHIDGLPIYTFAAKHIHFEFATTPGVVFFVCVFAQVEGHIVAERHTGGCECDPSIPNVFVFVVLFLCLCLYACSSSHLEGHHS